MKKKKMLKTEGTLYKLDNLQSFSSWMSVFTANSWDLSTIQTLLFSKHFHRFCCRFEWLEAQFQKNEEILQHYRRFLDT